MTGREKGSFFHKLCSAVVEGEGKLWQKLREVAAAVLAMVLLESRAGARRDRDRETERAEKKEIVKEGNGWIEGNVCEEIFGGRPKPENQIPQMGAFTLTRTERRTESQSLGKKEEENRDMGQRTKE